MANCIQGSGRKKAAAEAAVSEAILIAFENWEKGGGVGQAPKADKTEQALAVSC